MSTEDTQRAFEVWIRMTNFDESARERNAATAAWQARGAQDAARIAELERDAARYQWLRDTGDATWRPIALREGCSAELCNRAIDLARSASSSAEDA